MEASHSYPEETKGNFPEGQDTTIQMAEPLLISWPFSGYTCPHDSFSAQQLVLKRAFPVPHFP